MEHVKPDELAAYADRALDPDDLRRIEAHLVDCAECRTELVSGLRAALEFEKEDVIPLHQGYDSGSQQRRVRWPVLATLAAAAAVLIIAVPGVRDRAERSPIERNTPGIGVPVVPRIQIISPQEGHAIRTERPLLTWKQENDASDFQVSVTDAAGRVLWNATTSDTSIVLPRKVLNAGRGQYFWYVDALRADGRTLTSGVHSFTVQP